MNTVYSYSWLCDAMKNRSVVNIVSGGQLYTGQVNGIQLEDGSGRHFLVKLNTSKEWVYIRAE